MRKILIELSFDGTNYHGWQVQQNARAIQQVLQDALELLLHHRPNVTGCSRTDAGVHARRFYCTAETDSRFPAEQLPRALNANLPQDLSVLSAREVPESFHPRYSAKGKRYVYRLWNSASRNPFLARYSYQYPYPLDAELLNAAAALFQGTHDFSGFQAAGSEVEDTVRTVYQAEVKRQGELVSFSVEGDGFLYHMVRIMTGTLLLVAQGKLTIAEFPEVISACDRRRTGPTAPAKGLMLDRVYYPELEGGRRDG